MTEDERAKWLAQPVSRADVADMLLKLGSVTATLASTCAEILDEEKKEAVVSLRELIEEHREYTKLLRKFIGGADDE